MNAANAAMVINALSTMNDVFQATRKRKAPYAPRKYVKATRKRKTLKGFKKPKLPNPQMSNRPYDVSRRSQIDYVGIRLNGNYVTCKDGPSDRFFNDGIVAASDSSVAEGLSFFADGYYGPAQAWAPRVDDFLEGLEQAFTDYPGTTHIKIGKQKVCALLNWGLDASGDQVRIGTRTETRLDADMQNIRVPYRRQFDRRDYRAVTFGSDQSRYKQHEIQLFDATPTMQYLDNEVGVEDRTKPPARGEWIDVDYFIEKMGAYRLLSGIIYVDTPSDQVGDHLKFTCMTNFIVKHEVNQIGTRVPAGSNSKMTLVDKLRKWKDKKATNEMKNLTVHPKTQQ